MKKLNYTEMYEEQNMIIFIMDSSVGYFLDKLWWL